MLDNFEQVVAAAPLVADILRAAPRLKVIATSRAALRVYGEQEYPVPGLPTPPDPSRLSDLDRLNLPAARSARSTRSRWASSRRSASSSTGPWRSARLRGHERERPGRRGDQRAAAWDAAGDRACRGPGQAARSPTRSWRGSSTSSTLLAAGARDLPERQQTLRGAIAWSYDLLDDSGRRLLDRLSVFVGGFDLDAAEAIAGPPSDVGGDVLDGLTSLVDQSLVKVDTMPDGEPRFRLLESIRDFAGERLVSRGEIDLVQARHRDWFTALAARAATELSGDDQRTWLDRLDRDHDDIRAVLDRAVAAPDPPVAIGLAFSMWRFWQKRGHLAEARRRLEAMAAEPWSRDDPRLRAKLMEALGGTCWWQGQIERMGACYEEALASWLAIGDEAEIANAYYNASFRTQSRRRRGGWSVRPGRRRGMTYIERARDLFHKARRPARGSQCVVGARQLSILPAATGLRRGRVARSARDLPRGRRRHDGGVVEPHAGHRPPSKR